MGRKSRHKRTLRLQQQVQRQNEAATQPARTLRDHIASARIAFVISIVLLWMGTDIYRLQAETAAWPSTTATVLSARAETRTTSVRGRQSRSHYVIISYSYRVDGRRYESSTYDLRSNRVGSRAEADQIVADALRAGTVPIFYDPDDPARTFIVPPALAGSDLMLIAAGLAALGFGCYKVSEWHFLRAFYRARQAAAGEAARLVAATATSQTATSTTSANHSS